jgi:hypothetical protein
MIGFAVLVYVHRKERERVLLCFRICAYRESDSGSEYHAAIIIAAC